MQIETPDTEAALTEFLLFRDRVYQDRRAWWPTIVPVRLPMLTGESPFASGRTFCPLLVREGGEILATTIAVVDQRYIDHWNEPLGHLIGFEAVPGAVDATRLLMDTACGWLREHGMRAARCGFGPGEFPFVIDDYESLPPNLVQHNPAYYHCLLKDAGFESEKGWVDYKIEVTPDLVARWESALGSAKVAGYDIVPLAAVPEERRVADFLDTWNDAFKSHWGITPFTEEEFGFLFMMMGPMGMYDTSVIAYRDGEPVGIVWVAPEMTATAMVSSGCELTDAERLNFLGIGARESARGRGVNLAMAAYAYLELVRQGARYLSYTLVLDDNWPSRRTAEKLGAHVCANYIVYRRNFGSR